MSTTEMRNSFYDGLDYVNVYSKLNGITFFEAMDVMIDDPKEQKAMLRTINELRDLRRNKIIS